MSESFGVFNVKPKTSNFVTFWYFLVYIDSFEVNPIDECFSILCSALKNNQHLRKLNLDGASITEMGCKYISEVLTKNQTLIELDLGSNSIKDEGCKFLCEGLSNNSTLELLNIERKQIQINSRL
jgi:hypothetical protein